MSRRQRALSVSIEKAQPIGVWATWSYLEARTGLSRHEPAVLVPALDLLEEWRSRHHLILQVHLESRRAEKGAGRRSPSRGATTPVSPRRWHGDERTGAWHLLSRWRGRRPHRDLAVHPMGATVLTAVDLVLDDPVGLPGDWRTELQEYRSWATRRLAIAWQLDPAESQGAAMTEFLLGQVKLLVDGPLPLGETWNFTPPER